VPRDKKRIAVKTWHKVLGELRSMALAVPGMRHMFSLMQEAFRSETYGRLCLSTGLHDFLDDIRWLVHDLHKRPTRYRELVKTAPRVIGTTDAAAPGMGGTFFVRQSQKTTPFLWRAPFPAEIQQQVVSFKNPSGLVSNSDLELAGTIAHHDVVAHTVDSSGRRVDGCIYMYTDFCILYLEKRVYFYTPYLFYAVSYSILVFQLFF
jgi:hypothetical protein